MISESLRWVCQIETKVIVELSFSPFCAVAINVGRCSWLENAVFALWLSRCGRGISRFCRLSASCGDFNIVSILLFVWGLFDRFDVLTTVGKTRILLLKFKF